jgi:radical SAM superfamily enzyme YgiQ (UPF0313 family)
LAGLLAVVASIPRDQYEVVLTDENIETVDFDLKADLVGISAMTSYVDRGYEIADRFRAKGVSVVMGGVHPSFMPQEALRHCDAVVIGEVELAIDRLLDDLRQGSMRGTYRSDKLHPMAGMPMPRYDLLKKHRYVNRTFVQTSRGCHHGCTFCAEPLVNGLNASLLSRPRNVRLVGDFGHTSSRVDGCARPVIQWFQTGVWNHAV